MEIVVHGKFQKKLYHFNRNSQLRSVMYKRIQLNIPVGQKNPTPALSVVRNPTPPKNLRLLMTPAPHPRQRHAKPLCH